MATLSFAGIVISVFRIHNVRFDNSFLLQSGKIIFDSPRGNNPSNFD